MNETETATIGSEARNWALGAHLSALVGFVIPFGSIIGPLVIWLTKREVDPFIDDQAKEALNFNISVAIYAIGALILMLVLVGILVMIALAIFWLVMVIMAAVQASNGEKFRYPLSIRFIKQTPYGCHGRRGRCIPAYGQP